MPLALTKILNLQSNANTLLLLLIIVVIVLIIVTILQAHRANQLLRRYKRFMTGKKAQSLEGLLTETLDKVYDVERQGEKNRQLTEEVLGQYQSSFQKIGLVKYDALSEAGGKLSFSLCLLNGKNSGFVMNSVHSSEGCFTYTKEIINGNAVTVLSQEEKEAVRQAIEYRSAPIEQ